MKKLRFYLVFLINLAVLPGFAQSSLNDSIRQHLQIGIKGFKERYHSPSVVLAIVHKDSLIFSGSEGFTELDGNTPATIDSKYQIQSITKMFTATMMMRLWEKGLIRLDDDIRKYVPEFKGLKMDGTTEATSFLELATHSSGLPRNSPSEIELFKNAEYLRLTNKAIKSLHASGKTSFLKSLETVKKEYPNFEYLPIEQRHYSNLGYSLLGLALERVVKTDFDKYMRSEICAPLSLTNTGIGTIGNSDNVIAKGYRFRDDKNLFVQTPDFYAETTTPASGMYSTARDLAKFISSQFESSLLSEKSLRMMQSLGIGWQRDYPYLKHEGSMLGFRCEIVLHPRLEIGWVILTNTTDFEFNRFNEYISSLVLPAFAKHPVTDLEQYVGNYSLVGGNESFRIYQKDGKLFSTYLDDLFPDLPLKFSGNNSLVLEDEKGNSVQFNFIENANGMISLLNLNQLMWEKK